MYQLLWNAQSQLKPVEVSFFKALSDLECELGDQRSNFQYHISLKMDVSVSNVQSRMRFIRISISKENVGRIFVRLTSSVD